MTEIPQAFKDAIEIEWRHDDKMNADILTIGLRATAKTACRHEDAEKFKDFIEEHMASELYKLVSGIVGDGDESTKLRELIKDMWASMADCHDICATCKHFEDEYEAADGSFGHTGECVFLRRMHELGIEVDG